MFSTTGFSHSASFDALFSDAVASVKNENKEKM
jgi:hypothetical protein